MRRWRPRLRTILIVINLVILALPLGGIVGLRIYESALVRQTESELIAQGVFVAATYQALLEKTTIKGEGGKRLRVPAEYGVQAIAPPRTQPGDRWRPHLPELDFALDAVLPRPPDAVRVEHGADPYAAAVGEELSAILRNAQVITLAGIRVVDFNGIIVASTADDFGHSLATQDEIGRALSGEYVSTMRWRSTDTPAPPLDSMSRGTRIRVFVAVPILRGSKVIGAVLLGRTPANILQAIYGKRKPLMWAGLTLLLVVLALSLLTSRTIDRPVGALIDQAKRAQRGEQGAVTALRRPGTREIAELSETVAAMAQTLEQRANYIRDFAAQVSHEFKTPLTAIQGAVELLRDHADSMTDEERSKFLDILSGDTHRLEILVRRLLELARADVMQFDGEPAELCAVLRQVATRYRDGGMDATVRDCDPFLRVAIGPETLDSILSSLLDNARQHAGPEPKVILDATRTPGEPPTACIQVADNGHGISEPNRPRIFTPFFTTARKEGNTGLGLAIIRSLLRAHGGEILLVPAMRGTAFQIRLPLTAAPPRA